MPYEVTVLFRSGRRLKLAPLTRRALRQIQTDFARCRLGGERLLYHAADGLATLALEDASAITARRLSGADDGGREEPPWDVPARHYSE